MNFEGKVVLVVGATSGIGKATAESFAKNGAIVILSGRREEKGLAAAAAINAAGGKAEFIKSDARVLTEQEALINSIIAKYGKLDILHYNAGISCSDGRDAIGLVPEEVWDDIYNTNIKGAYFTFQYAWPYLQQTKGNVVFTCSTAGEYAAGAGGSMVYASTKAALSHLVKLIARSAAPAGIRVNGIAPGLTNTDILIGVAEDTMTYLANAVPLKRVAEPIDQAEVVVFLCSDEANFMTGQVVRVCGGATV